MGAEPILIVDDHPTNLKVLRVLLEAHGYAVRTAPDAEDALREIEASPPRLVLLDLQLPGMNGFDLARRLKSDPARAGIRIIAVTALAMKGDDERARAAGCDGYVTKPVDTNALAALVAAQLAASA